MKTLKITLALALLFVAITSFVKKDYNKTKSLSLSTDKHAVYLNGIAQD